MVAVLQILIEKTNLQLCKPRPSTGLWWTYLWALQHGVLNGLSAAAAALLPETESSVGLCIIDVDGFAGLMAQYGPKQVICC